MPGGSAERAREVLRRVGAAEGSALPLPRLLMVFAHPDDEVLAVGGRLRRMRASHLVTVTDGAPRSGGDARDHGFSGLEAYREARREELRAALEGAGLPEDFVLPFRAVTADQEAGMHLAAVARGVAALLERYRPEAVLTHPYEGGHPDHDACCFAVHAAVGMVAARGGEEAPVVIEAPFYNMGAGGAMRTGVFLEVEGAGEVLVARLSEEEAARKRARLGCFGSQAETLAQFGVEEERFRVAPRYAFGRPPHAGTLFYEQFAWGMRGEQFCALAGVAARELGLRGELS